MENNFQNNIDKLFSEESKKAEENTHFPAFEKVWEKVESRLDEKQKDTKTIKMWLPYSVAASLAVIFGSLYFHNKTETSSEKPKIVLENPSKNNVENPSTLATNNSIIENDNTINNLDQKIKKNIENQIINNSNSVAYNTPKPNKIVREFESKNVEIPPTKASAEMMIATPSMEGFNSKKDFDGTIDKITETETVKSVAMARKSENLAPKSAISLEQNQVYATVSNTDEAIDDEIFADVKISMNKNEPPLYIVDGYVADANFLKNYNVKKITSLNIVEGRSAVQLYGNSGKKGVVVITTKGLSKKEETELKENSQKYNLQN